MTNDNQTGTSAWDERLWEDSGWQQQSGLSEWVAEHGQPVNDFSTELGDLYSGANRDDERREARRQTKQIGRQLRHVAGNKNSTDA